MDDTFAKTHFLTAAQRNTLNKLIGYIVLTVLGIAFFLPFAWMLSTALKAEGYVFAFPPQWIPNPVQWSNFVECMRVVPFGHYLLNTALITGISLVGMLVSSTLVAYSFAKLRWPGRDIMFVILLSTMMLPGQVTMIPIYIMFNRMGWVDTWLPLTVPAFFGSPFFIFLLRQFFMSIPTELMEAAKIDGCSNFRIYSNIMVPLAKPAIATVAILHFLWTWNDFMSPLLYINSPEKYTVSLGLQAFQTQYTTNYRLMMAASLIALAPCLLLFFFGQKYFVQGVIMTGIKG
ncbi:MAG: carbohydrate ABC transporter permease [Firmicutes bacterium]|nr:carbohydrate ABC transporter permease [Bacillota bacterium]